MQHLYTYLLDPSEIKRCVLLCEMKCSVSRLELFDEFEEWYLIQSHYCLLVAAQGSLEESFDRLVKPSQSLVFSNKHFNCLQTRFGRNCAATSSSSGPLRATGASLSPAPRSPIYSPDPPSDRLPNLAPLQQAFHTCRAPHRVDTKLSRSLAASPRRCCTRSNKNNKPTSVIAAWKSFIFR